MCNLAARHTFLVLIVILATISPTGIVLDSRSAAASSPAKDSLAAGPPAADAPATDARRLDSPLAASPFSSASAASVSAGTIPDLTAAGPVAPPPAATGAAAFDVAPARAALERLVPRHHHQVRLRAIPAGRGGDRFRVTGRTGAITIEATTPAVLLTGFNAYLKHVAHADISWNGRQLNLPPRLPAPRADLSRAANVRHRFALNDTNDGYTGPYADWDYWRHEIDVLALHGINDVLVYVGADEVYYRTFREFGYTDDEIRSWIPAPSHQPWWLLQNLSGFGGPVSRRLLTRRADLARKIVTRLRELGMTPVLPGYFGTVPPGFADKNPGARVIPQGVWNGFVRPDWLDPRDPFFPRVAAAFYRHQRDLYGDTAMYKMDLLHEGGSPGDVPPADAARAVERALRRAHPNALWAILGWQHNPRPEILAAVDRDLMFIVDGLSDRDPPVTDRERDWGGTPYAFGTIWQYGGHTTMGVNAPDWVALYPRWRDKPGSALSGIALMPEAIDNNPAAFELFTELAWTRGTIDLDAWFTAFARARYGGDDPHARAAWRVLRRTAYDMTRTGGMAEAHSGLYGGRPDLTMRSANRPPYDFRYDPHAFAEALTELLQVSPRLRRSSAYRYDLVDVARQVLSNHSRLLLPRLAAAYDARDRPRFRALAAQWLRSMWLMDRLTGTQPQLLLGRWTAAARSWGGDAAERDRLEYAARALLTTWGGRENADAGNLHDYANREWSGLVGGLYLTRWTVYLAELDASLRENRPPRPIDWFALEDAWARSHARDPVTPVGDAYALATLVPAAIEGAR